MHLPVKGEGQAALEWATEVRSDADENGSIILVDAYGVVVLRAHTWCVPRQRHAKESLKVTERPQALCQKQ